ncbi:glycosyl transferase [Lactobacillus delbrueckii subsp. bulgaricus]|nr:glycosyl transferase [Lactobacillus delbrueckii subsp. bulgaricus]MBT8940311.1 glycosyl transferase [Lactobacillus delbrueckii subsp. bulgaricus]
MQDVFIIGSKGLGNYGGYETFVMKLIDYHASNKNICYHIACKANGSGCMDEKNLPSAQTLSPHHFKYRNAICYKIPVKEQYKSAQAIFYDIDALKWAIQYIKQHHIDHPIVYVLACRIGPFFKKYVNQIHKLGGKVLVNPDGHEWMRAKWSVPVRKYWKESERCMVKHADLLVCDSVNIEKYIQEEYGKYNPHTTFVAYGADVVRSGLEDTDPVYANWLREQGLAPFNYYYCCGRFVPENNFETMIREFMKSNTKRDFAIITTKNDVFLNELNKKLGFKKDSRIKFVGTVYNQELLKKIRESAYAYFHGHSVGGTNPSLLEALGSTRLNLLFDVGFNKEVGQDAALYWSKKPGDLAGLINRADGLEEAVLEAYGQKAKKRIKDAYSWQFIADRYEEIFCGEDE